MLGYERNGNHDNMPLRCDSCRYYNYLCVPRIDIVHPVPQPVGISTKTHKPICKGFEPWSPRCTLTYTYKGWKSYKAWLVEHIHLMRGYDEVHLTEDDPFIGIRGLFVSLIQGEYLYRLRLIDWMEKRYYDVLGNIIRYNERKPLDKRWERNSDYTKSQELIGKQGVPFWLRQQNGSDYGQK